MAKFDGLSPNETVSKFCGLGNPLKTFKIIVYIIYTTRDRQNTRQIWQRYAKMQFNTHFVEYTSSNSKFVKGRSKMYRLKVNSFFFYRFINSSFTHQVVPLLQGRHLATTTRDPVADDKKKGQLEKTYKYIYIYIYIILCYVCLYVYEKHDFTF